MDSSIVAHIASVGSSKEWLRCPARWHATAWLAVLFVVLVVPDRAAANLMGPSGKHVADRAAKGDRPWLYHAPRSKFMVMSPAFADQTQKRLGRMPLHWFNHWSVMGHLGHQLARRHALSPAWQRLMLYFGAAHDQTQDTARIAHEIGYRYRDIQIPKVFFATSGKELARFELSSSHDGKELIIYDKAAPGTPPQRFKARELAPRLTKAQWKEHDEAFRSAPQVAETAAEFDRQWRMNRPQMDLIAFLRDDPLALDLLGGRVTRHESASRDRLLDLAKAALWRTQLDFAQNDQARDTYQEALSQLPPATQEIASRLAREFAFLDQGFGPILTERDPLRLIELKYGYYSELTNGQPTADGWKKFIVGKGGKGGDISYAFRVTNHQAFYDVDARLAEIAGRTPIAERPVFRDFLRTLDSWTSDVGLTNMAFLVQLDHLVQQYPAVRRAVVELPTNPHTRATLPAQLKDLLEDTISEHPQSEYLSSPGFLWGMFGLFTHE